MENCDTGDVLLVENRLTEFWILSARMVLLLKGYTEDLSDQRDVELISTPVHELIVHQIASDM